MSAARIDDTDLRQLQREYALALRLLELGQQRDLEPFLREALVLVVDAVGARQGYLELEHDDLVAGTSPWWMAHGFTDEQVSTVRAAVSRGIIAESLATGRTVSTASALLDPRFSARDSVRLGQIEGVLCTPIGSDPPRGVLYLQGRSDPGPFVDEEQRRAESFARHLAPLVDRLLLEYRQRAQADATAPLRATLRLDGLVGRSAALAAAVRQAALVAPLDVNVLITGETGTGKSQLARIIHDNGPRASGPFIEINCAAIPENLVESELFGAKAGAFTGATGPIEGKVTAAQHGTLLLDEIGDLPLSAQAKLLQLLQSKTYYPLGSSAPRVADVRVIAATNHDLGALAAEKRFREDLLFRLQVLPIRMPSLVERREDVGLLANHFAAAACATHRLPRAVLSPGALRALEVAPWPGNVRQLENFVQAAAIRAAGEGVEQIEPAHVFPGTAAPAANESLTFQEATRRFQRDLLASVLEETQWNVVETARRLELARSHVYNLIRAFGLLRNG